MPKILTHPIHYDDAMQLAISKLKEFGYLDTGISKYGTVTWSSNGNKFGSISIMSDTLSAQPFIELNYKFKDEPRNYKIFLITIPSNLGKGFIWYFLCPKTKNLCRKLYSINGYFLHREAYHNCIYKSQTQNKTWRQKEKLSVNFLNSYKFYEELISKHFKKSYNGKPTKRYLKILTKIEASGHFTVSEIERLRIT